MTKILIINSDSPFNKGDQAILLGNLNLIKSKWPDSDITAISNFPDRDREWFGIEFIDQKVYTLNPIKILSLSLKARSFDYVFWGGGELLKDYTTKIAPLYWFFRVLILRIFGVKVYGLFQGIGPTYSALSKKLIKLTVDLCEVFFVRDKESKSKLISYGVVEDKVVSGYDPAILVRPTACPEKSAENLGISPSCFKSSIVVSVRKWFHYEQGSWAPHMLQPSRQGDSLSFEEYRANLLRVLQKFLELSDLDIIFLPMFNSKGEGDLELSVELARELPANRAMVLESGNISPVDLVNLFSLTKATLSSRLHSSIISISAGTPALCFYYVDKGRLYFDQIGASEFSLPIDELLSEEKSGCVADNLVRLTRSPDCQSSAIRQNQALSVELMKCFNQGMS